MPDHPTSRLGLCVALFVALVSVPGRHATAEPDRIAYIGHTGALYTIKPDGTDRRQLASGELLQPVSGAVPSSFSVSPAQSRPASRAAYSWPLWSPRGERLACFRIVLDEHGQTGELYIFDVASSRVLNAYTEPGLRPIYAYWAPDGHQLAVLRNRADTISLDLWPATGWQAPTTLARGAPFYFDWRADAAALHLHFVRRNEAGRSLDHVDAHGAKTLRIVVRLDLGPSGADAGENIRAIDRRPDGPQPVRGGVTKMMRHPGRTDQGLRGDASGPEAVAAQAVALDQCHARAQPRTPGRGHETCRTSADGDDVEHPVSIHVATPHERPIFLAGRPDSGLASLRAESYTPSCGVPVGLNEKPRPAASDPRQVS